MGKETEIVVEMPEKDDVVVNMPEEQHAAIDVPAEHAAVDVVVEIPEEEGAVAIAADAKGNVQRRSWKDIKPAIYQDGQEPLWSAREFDKKLVRNIYATAKDMLRVKVSFGEGEPVDLKLRADLIRSAANSSESLKQHDVNQIIQYANVLENGNEEESTAMHGKLSPQVVNFIENVEEDFRRDLADRTPAAIAKYKEIMSAIELPPEFFEFCLGDMNQQSVLYAPLKLTVMNNFAKINRQSRGQEVGYHSPIEERRYFKVSFSKETEELTVVTTVDLDIVEQHYSNPELNSKYTVSLKETRTFKKVDGVIVCTNIDAEVTVIDNSEMAAEYFSAVQAEIEKKIQYVTLEEKQKIFREDIEPIVLKKLSIATQGKEGEDNPFQKLFAAMCYKSMDKDSVMLSLQDVKTENPNMAIDMAIDMAIEMCKEEAVISRYFPKDGLLKLKDKQSERSLERRLQIYEQAISEETEEGNSGAFKEALFLNRELEKFYPKVWGNQNDGVVTKMRALRAAIEDAVKEGRVTPKVAAEAMHKVNLEWMNYMSYLAGPKKENSEPTWSTADLEEAEALVEQKEVLEEQEEQEGQEEQEEQEEQVPDELSKFLSSSVAFMRPAFLGASEGYLNDMLKEFPNNEEGTIGEWKKLLESIRNYGFAEFNDEELFRFHQILPLFKEYTGSLNSKLEDKEAYAQALALNEKISNKFYPIALGKEVSMESDPLVTQMRELRVATKEAVEAGHITPKVAAETLQKVNLELINFVSFLAGPRKNFEPATSKQDWGAIGQASMEATSPIKKWASRILMGVGVTLAMAFGAAIVASIMVATGGLAAIPVVVTFVAPVVSPTIAAAAVGVVAAATAGFGMLLDRSRRKDMEMRKAGVEQVRAVHEEAGEALLSAVTQSKVQEKAIPVERAGSIKSLEEVPQSPTVSSKKASKKEESEEREEREDTSKEAHHHASSSTFFHEEPPKPVTTTQPRPVSPSAGSSGSHQG